MENWTWVIIGGRGWVESCLSCLLSLFLAAFPAWGLAPIGYHWKLLRSRLTLFQLIGDPDSLVMPHPLSCPHHIICGPYSLNVGLYEYDWGHIIIVSVYLTIMKAIHMLYSYKVLPFTFCFHFVFSFIYDFKIMKPSVNLKIDNVLTRVLCSNLIFHTNE